MSERGSLLTRLLYDRYDSEDNNESDESVGVQAGFRYRTSEQSTLSALGGARFETGSNGQSTVGDNDNNSGPLLEVRYDRNYLLGELRMSVQRSLLPSGRGTPLDTTVGSIYVSRSVTERLSGSLTALGVRNRNPNGEINFNDRDYLSISPALRWSLSESSWLDLSYRYRWQDRESLAGIADSNAIYLGFERAWGKR